MKTQSVSLHAEREMGGGGKTENYFVQEIITQNWLIFFFSAGDVNCSRFNEITFYSRRGS